MSAFPDAMDFAANREYTARSNRQKADKDPVQWLPPHEPARCRYLTEWVSVKTRYALTVDTAEKQTLTDLAGQCPNIPLP